MKIAIHQNKQIFDHPITWEKEWILYCKKYNIEHEIIDCFRTDIISKLRDFDVLIWHYQNYVLQEMIFAKSILYAASEIGIKVFPNFHTAWHYDDKIAQTLLLDSIKAPIPDYWFFAEKTVCIDWIYKEASFPIIAKLKCGAGSHNVKMLKSKSTSIKYVKRIFGKGFKSSPNVLFKAYSNLSSATDLNEILKRIRKIPDFLQTLLRAKRFGMEKDYAYFQEFIPNKGYDLKIVIIKDKAFFFARNIRKGDFRASGGGSAFFDKSLVPKNVIMSAFKTSDKLKFQCMGYDYVVNEHTKEGKIIEMSFGFSAIYLEKGSGYWDRDFVWHEENINVASEVIQNLLNNSK